MRVNTSKLVFDNCRPGETVVSVVEEKSKKEEAGKVPTTNTSQTEYHKFNCFYPPALLKRPEFIYQNQIMALKPTDVVLLEQSLQ